MYLQCTLIVVSVSVTMSLMKHSLITFFINVYTLSVINVIHELILSPASTKMWFPSNAMHATYAKNARKYVTNAITGNDA